MESKKSRRRSFSKDFVLTVLRDYYSSEVSKNFICVKYGIDSSSLYQWLKKYDLDGKDLSLSQEIIERVKTMRKKNEMKNTPKTREQELEEHVANLRKALEYSELRNQAFMKVIEINSKEYGVDMLKKAGAKQ